MKNLISYEAYGVFMRGFLNVAVCVTAFGFMLIICFLLCRLFAFDATPFGLFAARIMGSGVAALAVVGIAAIIEKFIECQK